MWLERGGVRAAAPFLSEPRRFIKGSRYIDNNSPPAGVMQKNLSALPGSAMASIGRDIERMNDLSHIQHNDFLNHATKTHAV